MGRVPRIAGLIAGWSALIGWGAAVIPPVTGAAPAPAPLVRTYTGTITAGTGHYRLAYGAVTIDLTLAVNEAIETSTPATDLVHYEALLVVHGAKCAKRKHRAKHAWCLPVAGTLRGEGQGEQQHIPDTGGSVHFAAAAPLLGALGAVTAKCAIYGVGFIMSGRRTIVMELLGSAGAVWITAMGPVVPGFSGL